MVLCDDTEGWDERRWGVRKEGISVYMWLIHFTVKRNSHIIVRQLYHS